jgi:hypothetical protein
MTNGSRSLTAVAWGVALWPSLMFLMMAGRTLQAAEAKVPVTFSGGHETDPQDRGRPVVLVAGALGVKPEVFRKAF